MTKEALIKLSRENLRKSQQGSLCECYDEAFIKGYELSERRIANLEKENKELKTVKIPQLERKIASIRGAHSVDYRKLEARREQVERLKEENAELKEDVKYYEQKHERLVTEWDNAKRQLIKAKEIIREFVEWATWKGSNCPSFKSIQDKAEQFLKDVE